MAILLLWWPSITTPPISSAGPSERPDARVSGQVTTTFSNSTPIAIPAAGTSGPASPYPSTITVSGLAGMVTKVTVTLSRLSHTFPDDIDILLQGPGGQTLMLMSDVGGSVDINNITLTLDDAAASALPDAGPLVSGTFRPTDSGTTDNLPSPAPTRPFTGTTLAAFNNVDPNGTWRLWVADDVGGDVGSLAGGWALNITITPPTSTPTATATPTSTPTATATATSTATATGTPTGTATPTSTPTATATATSTPTSTATATGTAAPTPSATATGVPTSTATATAASTATATPLVTASPTATPSAVVTGSATPTPTASPTVSRTATAVPSVTATPPAPQVFHAFVPGGSLASGGSIPTHIDPGPCPRPLDNCVEFTVTGSFTVVGAIRGLPVGAAPTLRISVVTAAGTPAGARSVACGPANASGVSACNALVAEPGILPQPGLSTLVIVIPVTPPAVAPAIGAPTNAGPLLPPVVLLPPLPPPLALSPWPAGDAPPSLPPLRPEVPVIPEAETVALVAAGALVWGAVHALRRGRWQGSRH